ncbi:MAG: DUF1697 domain-containing protein [Patescibacteria group bacterium]
MKYVAFLRGINVGGKGKVSMSDLKIVFEKLSFQNVVTYINSGNVVFDTDEIASLKLEKSIEKALLNAFFDIPTVVLSEEEIDKVVKNVPKSWMTDADIRKYIAFIKAPNTPQDFLSQVTLKKDVDEVHTGPQVVYMTTKMSGITKSGFTKLISKPIYKSITIRNFNTVSKVEKLMAK